jgi:hypothetical protein
MVQHAMPPSKPLWLRAVHRVERTVGGPVEAAVRSETYFDAVARVTRTRRSVTGAVEGVSRRCLHLANLPAGTDVRRLREQLSRMERRLNRVSEQLAELESRDGLPDRTER